MHEELRLTLVNELRELTRVNEAVTSFLESRGRSAETVYRVNLAVEEILSNVIRHGYLDAGHHEISLCVRAVAGPIELCVVDDGCEFDPLTAPEVDIHAPLEQRRAGGLGIHLLRKFASALHYERTAGENRLQVHIN